MEILERILHTPMNIYGLSICNVTIDGFMSLSICNVTIDGFMSLSVCNVTIDGTQENLKRAPDIYIDGIIVISPYVLRTINLNSYYCSFYPSFSTIYNHYNHETKILK
uniref:Uncharacterized protein n=1 Tax=Rhizophagus irregularis (strain DAOM 181602 / DAOM 197198 / MUCL 43194) TaxID=747089 RepID=U9THB8_RHIID